MLSVSTQISQADSLASFERMLRSVSFADEVVIFNFERTDFPFFSLAKKYHAKVIECKTPQIVELVRDDEIRATKNDWVLVMDGDEVIPSSLASEIKAVIQKPSASAYYLIRRNYSLGYPLNRGGWDKDSVLRLFYRADFVSWGKEIHALPVVSGTTRTLTHHMEHHKDEDLETMVGKTNRYSEIESQQFLDGGLPLVTSFTLIRKWWMESFRRGIIKRGIFDGAIGLIQSLYQGFSVFISYAKLYEKQINHTSNNRASNPNSDHTPNRSTG